MLFTGTITSSIANFWVLNTSIGRSPTSFLRRTQSTNYHQSPTLNQILNKIIRIASKIVTPNDKQTMKTHKYCNILIVLLLPFSLHSSQTSLNFSTFKLVRVPPGGQTNKKKRIEMQVHRYRCVFRWRLLKYYLPSTRLKRINWEHELLVFK